MNYIAEDILMHYGTKYHSGRYPYGSGEDPYQHSGDFISRVEELRKQNYTFTDASGKTWTGDMAIAKSWHMSSGEFRTKYSIAKDERRARLADRARSLREHGYSLNEIAKEMGYENDSSVRALLNPKTEARMNAAKDTAKFLKEQVDSKGMIDIGPGVELELNISRTKFDQSVAMLENEGYSVYSGRIPQATNPGKWTTVTVIGPPGTKYKDIYNWDEVHSLKDYVSYDMGKTFETFKYPSSMNSSRLKVKYAEEGGVDKDGLVEIRRGTPDLDLGNSRYAQVRILVDGTHYIKGMAVYGDDKDFPDGVDVIFNSNKSSSVGKLGALKKIKEDPTNPFGSLIKEHGGQSYFDDPNGEYTNPLTGKKQSLSLINKRAEEGDWNDWDNKLSSQFLSKQPQKLINSQLDMSIADKEFQFDEIKNLTNPTVKKQLLETFANDCDSAAVHLKAAALPRQSYKVILPMTSIKDNEVYAPHCADGEKVALIRYPHGGTFEIPILTVNNKLQEGKRALGTTPSDAIGINSKVAARLSGADFDGDTVMVIPVNSKVNISSTPALRGLKGFDPTMSYGPDSDSPVKVGKDGSEYYTRNGQMYKRMRNTQVQMGIVSNLITDMTLKGANDDEIARAVRHSMVVIDAEKHKLDYKASERENNIAELKSVYQGAYNEKGKYHEGSSTLISKASSETQVLKRKGTPKVNIKGKPYYDPNIPEGALIYKSVEETYVDKNGKIQVRTQKSTKMAETHDAFSLVSDMNTAPERAYARYANKMKALANEARKELVSTGNLKYEPSAYEAYKPEVESLKNKLFLAQKNAPRERKAQMLANSVVKAKIQSNPEMRDNKKEIKKASQQALVDARITVGAKRHPIDITDREWDAIQSGAIHDSTLKNILKYADIDQLRERATPRTHTTLSPAKLSHIQVLKESGYTTAQIADKLGVSTSTVSKYLSGKE